MHGQAPTRLACWNGALWALGNGLLGSPLVIYLAQDLGVPRLGAGVGLILAAPHLVGVLRLAAPAMIGRLAGRKPFCIACYLLSGVILGVIPGVALAGHALSAHGTLALLVSGWCCYHLLEYLATVALWSWLADLCPAESRGRFLGRRERWMTLAQAAAMLGGGLYVWGWAELHPREPRWGAYVVPALLGLGFLVASIVPLLRIPAAAPAGKSGGLRLREMLVPFVDRRYLAVLAVFCWFSLVNGLIASPQNLFPNQVLGLGLFAVLALKVGVRMGQWPLGPGAGSLADRRGNRLVLWLGYGIVGQAPLFFLAATREHPWWIVGASVCWVAWVGVNVGMPNLLLQTAPPRANTPHIAVFYAVTGLCHGASTYLGGVLFDRFGRLDPIACPGLSYYHVAFLAGWAGYMAGVFFLLLVVRKERNPTPQL